MANGVVSEGSNLPGDLASDNLHITSPSDGVLREALVPLTIRNYFLNQVN